jgi:hypothetical protein
MVVMDSRAHMAVDAIGSVRAEGLEPGSTVIEILDRWSEGAIATEQLGEAAQRLVSGESVAHLLGVGARIRTPLTARRTSFRCETRSRRCSTYPAAE